MCASFSTSFPPSATTALFRTFGVVWPLLLRSHRRQRRSPIFCHSAVSGVPFHRKVRADRPFCPPCFLLPCVHLFVLQLFVVCLSPIKAPSRNSSYPFCAFVFFILFCFMLLWLLWFVLQLFLVLWKRRSYTLAFRWGVHKEGEDRFEGGTGSQAVCCFLPGAYDVIR